MSARGLARLIGQVQYQIQDDCHAIASEHGLTRDELKILVVLNDAGGGPVEPATLNVLPGENDKSIHRHVDRLHAKNCVRRVRDLDDRRKVGLILTREGMDRLKALTPALSARLSQRTDALSHDDRVQLATLLRRML